MATIKDAARAIERRLGIPASRARTVARRLQEADVLPNGPPGRPLHITRHDAAMLVLALLTDAPLRSVADIVRRYAALPPLAMPHLPADVADRMLGLSPLHALETFFGIAMAGNDDDLQWLAQQRLTVVQSWQSVVIGDDDVSSHYLAPGLLLDHWNSPVLRSATVAGLALRDFARDLKFTR